MFKDRLVCLAPDIMFFDGLKLDLDRSGAFSITVNLDQQLIKLNTSLLSDFKICLCQILSCISHLKHSIGVDELMRETVSDGME